MTMMRGMGAFVLAAALAVPAAAADYVWRNVKVGGGGYIPAIVYSKVEKNLAYLRTDMGGIYRWEAGRQKFLPLEDNIAERNFQGIESIAPDPKEGNVVYAAIGTYRNGPAAIFRSEDRGDHWTINPVPFRMGGNEEGRDLGERLAVDPNATSILYFGSRHDGLQKSTDKGKTWARVASFPHQGLGTPAAHEPTHAGLSFVVFDPRTGKDGQATRTLFVGVADKGAAGLYRSDDAGMSWKKVPGGPGPELLPGQGQFDAKTGKLYITYADSMGPYGASKGAVFQYDVKTGAWTDITPPKKAAYMGLALDARKPGTLVVATLDLDDTSGDSIYRSTDGGAHWVDLRPLSKRDVSSVPWLLWGKEEAKFGWWITGIAIDPFDSERAAYTTGATIYATDHLSRSEKGEELLWKPWVEGVEQTAVLTLAGPKEGAHLISGFGDIGGFTHSDLAAATMMHTNPIFVNTNTIDIAGQNPAVIVRSGSHEAHARVKTATLGYSTDYGKTWQPLFAPPPAGYTVRAPEDIPYNFSDPYIDAAIITAADGKTFMVMIPDGPVITTDLGQSWIKVKGLPPRARPVADKVDPKRFYALDFATGRVFLSVDGGASFQPQKTKGLSVTAADDPFAGSGWPPVRERPWPLISADEKAGELWLIHQGRLYRSTDGGAHFAKVKSDLDVRIIDFGKAAPGAQELAMYALGSKGGVFAIWQSLDRGAHWTRINDADSEYCRMFRAIAADKKVFGRVYVGIDGRGIVYGEPK